MSGLREKKNWRRVSGLEFELFRFKSGVSCEFDKQGIPLRQD